MTMTSAGFSKHQPNHPQTNTTPRLPVMIVVSLSDCKNKHKSIFMQYYPAQTLLNCIKNCNHKNSYSIMIPDTCTYTTNAYGSIVKQK